MPWACLLLRGCAEHWLVVPFLYNTSDSSPVLCIVSFGPKRLLDVTGEQVELLMLSSYSAWHYGLWCEETRVVKYKSVVQE